MKQIDGSNETKNYDLKIIGILEDSYINNLVNFSRLTRDEENKLFTRLNGFPDLYENPTKARFKFLI